MKTPLAWKNLRHNKLRTAIGVLGVGFSVVLIFMQLGFMGSIERTATQIYDSLEFDLLLRSPAYLHLTEARSFPATRLRQVGSVSGVAKIRPLWFGLSEWQAPEASSGGVADEIGGMMRGIIVMGIDPKDPPFRKQVLNEAASSLTDSRMVLIDTKTKVEYGPRDGRRFGPADVGVETALGPSRVRIAGLFELGAGMACNGSCMASESGYQRALPWHPPRDVTFGLVSIQPGAEVRSVKSAIAGFFERERAEDVEVLTRDQALDQERHRWLRETPFGQILTLGVWIAVLVGVAVVYQVLSNDIENMLSEYATLKAMGYSDGYLTGVVMQQALLLAVLGYIPSMLVALGLYELVEWRAGIPMTATPQILVSVFLLTVGICAASGVAALRKLYRAEPADLF